MTPGDIHVVVADLGIDCVFLPDLTPLLGEVASHSPDGDILFEEQDLRPLLFLAPGQTFESAAAAVEAMIPDLHPDQVRALIREAAPTLLLRDPPLTPVTSPVQVVVDDAEDEGEARPAWLRVALAAASGVLVPGLMWAWAWDLAAGPMDSPAADAGAHSVVEDFVAIQMAAGLSCLPEAPGRGRCHASDGTVLTSQRAMSPARTTWVFSWDGHEVSVQRFDDEASARQYAKPRPGRYVQQAGPWVVAGTDRGRVQVWAGNLPGARPHSN